MEHENVMRGTVENVVLAPGQGPAERFNQLHRAQINAGNLIKFEGNDRVAQVI